MKKIRLLQQIHQEGIVAVIRGDSAEEAIEMSQQAIKGGIHVIEITMTVPGALKAIEHLRSRYLDSSQEPDIIIGAGTVLDSETARSAILAGSEFIVSPSLSSSTVTLCHRYRIPVMPGCMTIQEIQQALELGVDVVKLFPGNVFKPSIIPAMKGPLPQANLMPTGGVNLNNLQEWVQAGAFAIGIGSDLTKEAVQSKDYSLIQKKAAQYVAAFKSTQLK